MSASPYETPPTVIATKYAQQPPQPLTERIIRAGVAVTLSVSLTSGDFAPRAEQPPIPCGNFSHDILEPPTNMFGIADPGNSLDSRHLATADLAFVEYHTDKNGNTYNHAKLGTLAVTDCKVENNVHAPEEYKTAVATMLQDDPLRWSLYHLGGGMNFTALESTKPAANAFYNSRQDSIDFLLQSGTADRAFQDERDLLYAASHESGHMVREHIASGNASPEAVALTQKLELLYKRHVELAFEEYRSIHHAEIAADYATFARQFEALSPKVADAQTKQLVRKGVALFTEQLQQVNGLSQVGFQAGGAYGSEASHLSTNSVKAMYAQLSRENGTDVPSMGLLLSKHSEKIDKSLLVRHAEPLSKFLTSRLVNEQVMPGNNVGHVDNNSDEHFATLWNMTQHISPDNFDKAVEAMPDQYKILSMEELRMMMRLRQSIDIATF
jgi:hypothetical protein